MRSTPTIKITEDAYRNLEELAKIEGKTVQEVCDECIDYIVKHPLID